MVAVTVVLDPFMHGVNLRPPGIQRGRGGFLRSADDSPYVSDPLRETVKSGERKGEVKRLKYGSPSGAGRLIENDIGLTKFKQRKALLGIGMSDQLREACKALVDMDPESDEFATCADRIVVDADTLTRSWLAADRGTHGHLICERWDRGEGRLDIIDAGLALGLTPDTQYYVETAWKDMLEHNGLEVLAVEASCVDDQWRLAGTLDRIVRCIRPLRFVRPGGEFVDIPAGTVLVLDIKFGAVRRAHLIQIASYAQSLPYNTETEERHVWPWVIDQRHALIAQGDFGGDGCPVTIKLVWVDLAAGREHGGQTMAAAKDWNSRDDLWSVSQASAEPVQFAPSKELPFELAGDIEISVNLADAVVVPDDEIPAKWESQPARLALVDARAQLNTNPDQGADVDEVTFAAAKAHYARLDPAGKAWIAELIGQAKRRGVTFHAREVRSVRTFELYRGLIALAAADHDDDEILRALLAGVVGDVALMPGVEPGHVVGSLDWREASRFAALVDAYNAPASA